jgi:TPP-dependent pyruvate/acetoin dehydrogenase alpha subunit
MDVLAVEDHARRAAEVVRAGNGPLFLDLRTYRFRAHSMYDPERYRERAEVDEWRARDPLVTFPSSLGGLIDQATIAELERDVAEEIEQAVAFAEAATLEPVEQLEQFVCMDTVP